MNYTGFKLTFLVDCGFILNVLCYSKSSKTPHTKNVCDSAFRDTSACTLSRRFLIKTRSSVSVLQKDSRRIAAKDGSGRPRSQVMRCIAEVRQRQEEEGQEVAEGSFVGPEPVSDVQSGPSSQLPRMWEHSVPSTSWVDLCFTKSMFFRSYTIFILFDQVEAFAHF